MIEQQKRKGPELPLVPVKRQRHELLLGAAGSGPGAGQQQAAPGALLQAGPPRCSSLQAPIMLLSGHEGEVYCCKFHPNGSTLASAGFDRLILLWNVYGDCDNYATLKGHSGAVMELHYNTDGSMLFSASTDKTVAVWDSETGERVKRLKGHTSFVNSCYPARRGPQLVCTGSDDGTVKLWDIRKKAAIQTFQNTYQVLAVTFNDTSDQIISGGIDNDIKVWDLRQNKLTYTMRGHADSVTGLSLSSEGSYLLSNAMDNTVRVWDVRPFAPKERCVKIFQGNVHNFEKNLLRCSWSPDGSKIAAGSADSSRSSIFMMFAGSSTSGIPQAGGFCISYRATLAPSMKWLSTPMNPSFSQHPVTRDYIWGRFSEDMEWKTPQDCLTLRPQTA
ncbi:U5 small nuclear ribonucleoprotein 40 kDa protein isoform X2 [Bubalus kerabau]|uniref:U5 small nuclear ribonucleoprotein 40 kDa protein isoform X1 n=1 Tax=Bubalus bubalis TaxID=89462 RepID=UPI000DBC8A3F|nr:U5 small nuclear ribonucleoprotein 40 kDa protein isoform X1 [Bubalus bubalis]XP_055429836.1 U5 small nuclear ribonucleoprotein 40 kDa protein isoform X2 [Bubalus carabanensis]